jgi:glutathione synthase
MKKIAIWMNELPPLKREAETTFAMIDEYLKMGYKVWIFTDAYFEDGKVIADGEKMLEVNRKTGLYISDDEVINLNDFDIVWLRKDPPVDLRYITNCQILSNLKLLKKPPVLLNDPAPPILYSEKSIILQFPKWTPKTIITTTPKQINNFIDAINNRIVIKPLHLYNAHDIMVLDKYMEAPIVSMFKKYTHLMVQEYLGTYKQGLKKEKRIFLVDGKLFIAYERNYNGEIYSYHYGSHQKTTLTDNEKEMAKEVGKFCQANNLFFVVMDVLEEKLIELNITSPGELVEIEQVYGKNLVKKIVELSIERSKS